MAAGKRITIVVFIVYSACILYLYRGIAVVYSNMTESHETEDETVLTMKEIHDGDPKYSLSWSNGSKYPNNTVFRRNDPFNIDTMYGFPLHCNAQRGRQQMLRNRYHAVDYTLFLYTAFLDSRNGSSYIRILAMMRSYLPEKPTLWCHLYSESEYIGSSPAEFYEMNENHKFLYGGWIVSCPVPNNSLPCDVMISKHASNDINAVVQLPLLAIDSPLSNTKINVCVPPLFGNLSGRTLIEFVEMGIILGISHFTFYAFEVSKQLDQVLRYYVRRKIVTIISWGLPFSGKYHIWYNGQMVSINDCLYRSMAFFTHTAFIDLDEMIIPQGSLYSWEQIIDSQDWHDIAGLRFTSAQFPVKNPTSFPTMLQETQRSIDYVRSRSKVIVRPKRVFEMGIHHVSRTIPEGRNFHVQDVNTSIAVLHHYVSGNCKPSPCKQLIFDSIVVKKYSRPLKERCKEVYSIIKFEE